MPDLFIPTILGTARRGRRSEDVAAAVVDLVKQRSILTELVDVADFRLDATGADDTNVARYRELVTAADGLIIVAPEYNHSIPGELKLLLDSEYAAYARKPLAIVSVSSGRIGGARMAEQLQLVATALRLVPVSPALRVVEVEDALDRSGCFAWSSLVDVAQALLDEVEWFARALTSARTGRN